MSKPTVPTYTQLVYSVLRAADAPLTVDEIVAAVNELRPITAKNPKDTIRGVLVANPPLVSVGNRRYDYLPHVVNGSVLRIPLSGEDVADEPLIYPNEVRDALWPAFFESQSRRDLRPARLTLPNGETATLPLEGVGKGGIWGCGTLPDPLRRLLVEREARESDSLVIRVTNSEAGLAEVEFAARRDRDDLAMARRNQALVDEAEKILRRDQTRPRMFWEITLHLLAHGSYQDPLAPDALFALLEADERFVDAGLDVWMLADAMTPKDWDLVELRRAMERDIMSLDPDSPMDLSLSFPFDLKNDALSGSSDNPIVFLDQLRVDFPGEASAHYEPTALEDAQDLIYEAWKTESRRKRIRLAREALEISPDCADAYVLLAEETARTAAEAARLYAKGVAAGERALGPQMFEENVGYFWGILETRPYMRALGCLAEALWAVGQQEEAIGHIWEMLRLNPGDNQGVRYWLLNWLLERGNDADARRLLDQYPDEVNAVWQYGRALHAFRAGGDTRQSRKLLKTAREWNPHVPAYLLGIKQLPAELPPFMGVGDPAEAIYCVATQFLAWQESPGALDWLINQIT